MYHSERVAASYRESMDLAKPAAEEAKPAAKRPSAPPPARVEKRCFTCERKVPLHAQVWPCNCGQVFCDSHRRPEQHACAFDYQAAQRAKLRRENQQVRKPTASLVDAESWHAEYIKDHKPKSLDSLWHAIGCVVVLLVCACGLLRLLLGRGSLLGLAVHLPIGYGLGYLTAHAVPALYLQQAKRASRPTLGGACRFCVFSCDVKANPTFACLAEIENVKALLGM